MLYKIERWFALIYLDIAATSGYNDVDDIVVDTITDSMKQYWQNPSSLYASNVKEEINKCRTNIAKFINAKPDEIIFTSGASESNNLAIRGWVDAVYTSAYKIPKIITTRIEHKSILQMLDNGNLQAIIGYCDINEFGFVNYQSLEQMLLIRKNEPVLVSVHMANNEIGTIQDIKKIADLVHKYDSVLHVDATQAFGKIPIDVERLGIDLMSTSGHKISPVLKGIGFLYKKNGINIQPLIYGTQENGLRGGTENTFGIIGLSKALEFCDVSDKNTEDMCCKRDYFIRRLVEEFNCQVNGSHNGRLPNNISVTFPQNITGEALLYTLDLSDIKIGVGSACNSKTIAPSHVLKAIGLSDEEAMKTIRITLPEDITYENIDYVINEIDISLKLIESN